MKLTGIIELKGRIRLRSGLHIGAGDMEMHIGGTDNPVVKHPHTNEPYIPGSSLKGKIRALLEMRSGLMRLTGGRPLSAKNLKGLSGDEKDEAIKILKLFGTSGADGDEAAQIGPTRASFADCYLADEYKDGSFPLTEIKSENSINRIRGTAENPRFTERVPAGLAFEFSITVKKMEGDEDLESFLLEGLKLLELDALGGNGSRGYGRVEFKFSDPEHQAKYEEILPL